MVGGEARTVVGGKAQSEAALDFQDAPRRPNDERKRIFSRNYHENFRERGVGGMYLSRFLTHHEHLWVDKPEAIDDNLALH